MIVAVCPHTPLLVDAFDPHRQADLVEVRAAALDAARRLVAARPSRVTVVAAGVAREHDESAGGTLAGFGVDVRAGGSDDVLPSDATVGAWLLDAVGWDGARRYVGVDGWSATDDAVLVLADGTVCRTARAPGNLDPRAAGLDGDVAKALAEGDAAALTRIDADLAADLGMSGRAGLVAMAEAVMARTAGGTEVDARLQYDAAPLGVGYWVAEWRVA